MRISYELLDEPIIIKPGEIACLTIENTKEYRRIVNDIINTNNHLSIYNKAKQLQSKDILIVDNLVNLDLNDKKILNKLYKELEISMNNEDILLKSVELRKLIMKFMEELIFEFDYPLEVADELDVQSLLKSAGIRVYDDSESYLENLINYIALMSNFLSYKVVIILNLQVFLDKQELKEFIKFCTSQSLHIISLERVYINNSEINGISTILFDNDLCRVL